MTSLAFPPFIMTSEENSFARETIATRKPSIIKQILIDNAFPATTREALLALKTEMETGNVRLLNENTEDRSIWDHDIHPWLGKSWLDIPWFLAETYFFRRVLEAIGYFQPGGWEGCDPFSTLKNQENTNALSQFITAYNDMTLEDTVTGFSQAVGNALWGNQADLSNLDRGMSSPSNPQMQLLIDDSAEAYHFLRGKPANIIYFLDNVGKEIYFDLALMDYLLWNELARSITIWLKNQPFFCVRCHAG